MGTDVPEEPTHWSDQTGAPPRVGPPLGHLNRAASVFEIDHAMPAEYGVVGRVLRGTVTPGDHLLLYANDGSAEPVEAGRVERLTDRNRSQDEVWALYFRAPVHRYSPLGGAPPRLEVATGQLLLGFTEGQAPLREIAAREVEGLLEARGLDPLRLPEMEGLLDRVATTTEADAMAHLAELRPEVPDPELLSLVRRVRRVLRPDDTAGGGQCFIATAACGSSQAPDVLALRSFRDRVLLSCPLGRLAWAAYLAVSPPIASLIAGRASLRWIIRSTVVRPAAWLTRVLLPSSDER